MYQTLSYIKFLFSSTNQHGVHSPFIYNFVTKCLYDKFNYPEYKKLNTYRNTLKQSNTILEITDLGEGSKVLGSKKRRVAKMIRNSSSTKKETKLLFKATKYFDPKTILELGTSLGMGAYALALANKDSSITTIEGCPNTSNFTKSKFRVLEVKNVSFVRGDFTLMIPSLKKEKFDFIFFDGHHNKAATIQYFKSLLPKIHNETVFVFDDIYWSKGMTEAWEYIKSHEAVTVTVDCFHLGFVFFRKEQAKEHFRIRV
ncbi:class I SAM-dependent methyltransferase [Winogradskyella sp. WHY3]|uniref:Class I SAM-dependent methyltransferase n=2 Tax=Winogradskyella luteola TaxID=2828330 RepID=A0A9X1F706_9FLAO|nr:class I SAM-dependent methyltransferase [Winogradskyella luteola]